MKIVTGLSDSSLVTKHILMWSSLLISRPYLLCQNLVATVLLIFYCDILFFTPLSTDFAGL